jgi:hypothetical protein
MRGREHQAAANYVNWRGRTMAQVRIGSEAVAVLKDTAEATARTVDEGGEEILGRAVEVGKERERERAIGGRRSVGGDIGQSHIVEDDEAGEVDGLKTPEGDEPVLRVDHPGAPIHRGE